ncbi:class I SAM-dependent methyltransferase [Bacillus gobiensis]|uniref:class I SAM-dependent methyltransferase n=1 Tax=Bacillus gobiensis TaxID=1441095 RepID=UPI003D221D42
MDNNPNTEHKTEEITTAFECQFCENKFQQFIPWSDKSEYSDATLEVWNKNTAICPHCFSMDRERMYRLYIEEKTDLKKGLNRILHIGLEPSLRNWLKDMSNVEYSGGYVTSESGSRKLDLTNLDYPDETFDVIICSHVLERVPDDEKAMKELHRVLRNDGWAIMQAQIALHANNSNKSTVKIYRRKDFVKKLEKSGFTVVPIHLVQTFGDSRLLDIFRYGLSANDILYTVIKNNIADKSGGTKSAPGIYSTAGKPAPGIYNTTSEPAKLGFFQKTMLSIRKAWQKLWE